MTHLLDLRFALGILAVLCLAGCGPSLQRDRNPQYVDGDFTLVPPAAGPVFAVIGVSTSVRPSTWTSDLRQIPKTLDVEICVSEAAVLRAADFRLLRSPLSPITPERADDIAPRVARGIAAGDGATFAPRVRLSSGEVARIRFEPVEMRTWTHEGGHPVPLRMTLEHPEQGPLVLMDPGAGQPAWALEPSTWRSYLATEGFAGGGEGALGGSFAVGARLQFERVAMTLAAATRVSSVDAPDSESPPRGAIGAEARMLVGYLLPIAEQQAFRLGAGWSTGIVSTDRDDGAWVHALPLELALVSGTVVPVPITSTDASSVGLFVRVTPRLGTLDGDRRFGQGIEVAFGVELTPL